MTVLEYARELVKLVKTLSGNGSEHGEFSRLELLELFTHLETQSDSGFH